MPIYLSVVFNHSKHITPLNFVEILRDITIKSGIQIPKFIDNK